MSKAMDILKGEHRLIEQVLDSLEVFLDQLDGDGDPRQALRDYAYFFRYFSDKFHHGKEEDLLFRRMIEHGFPEDAGPVACMLEEHLEGRDHVTVLALAGEGTGPLSEREREQVRTHGRTFIHLLRQHIQKEDRVLFPLAEQVLRADALQRLGFEFEHFETSQMSSGSLDHFQAVARSLLESYPPVLRNGSKSAPSGDAVVAEKET